MESKKQHWENVFTTNAPNEVSWFQEYPKTSIEFLELYKLPLTANIIDIGGGDSNFVDALLKKGYQNIWVLDISATAFFRPESPTPSLVQLAGTPGCYGEQILISSTFFPRIISSTSTTSYIACLPEI